MNTTPLILAELNRARALFRDAFPREGRDPTQTLQSFAAVLVAFALTIAVIGIARHYRNGLHRSPRAQAHRLFMQCLKQLGLSQVDRLLLHVAGKHCHYEQPTVMLFSAELFNKSATRWVDTLLFPSLRPWARKRLAAVSQQLFPAPAR